MSTIRDVAKLAGVSVATVSRVINQKGYISKDTEKKIKACMAKLQYSPSSVARGLAGKKTDTIALLIPDITNPFFPEIARAVEDTASSYGITTLLGNCDENGVKELRYLDILKKRYVDGIIFAEHGLTWNEIHGILGSGMPIVSLDRAALSEEVSSVRVNHYQGAVLAVEHLLSIGCRRIAHISGPNHLITSANRNRGYTDTLRNAGCFDPDLVYEGDFSMECGMRVTEQLLKENEGVDGIFTSNDLMAVGALKTLIRSGIKVPEDVALIGFDGISMTQMVEPEISTIAQPIYEIGKQAVFQLIHQIEDRHELPEMTPRVLETKLIQRATTTRF